MSNTIPFDADSLLMKPVTYQEHPKNVGNTGAIYFCNKFSVKILHYQVCYTSEQLTNNF